MNNFYLAKRSVKLIGYLNIFNFLCWSFLIFLIFVYHFLILINLGPNYSFFKTDATSGTSSDTVSENYSSQYIQTKGYGAFFSYPILSWGFFTIKFWYIIFPLFLAILISFIVCFCLGLFSLFSFIKAKNMFLINATVAGVFLPLIGGFIALDFYNSTQNSISPEFIKPYSLLRRKISIFWSNLNDSGKEKRGKNLYA